MARNAIEWAARPKVPEDHYVSSLVYRDEQLFAEEQDRLLGKTWKFACHVSEIEKAGDYRTLTWCGVPLVVIRGSDEQIRTFVNVCSHRSARIARGPSGNAKPLICFFHVWSYDTQGHCVNQTRPEGYEEAGPRKEDCGLRAVRTEVAYGLVFVNLDDDAVPLERYLGNSMDTLAEALGTVPLEVFHYHQAEVRANWKQWHETNMELYHEWGHVVNRRTGIAAPGYHDRTIAVDPNGHAVLPPYRVSYAHYKGWSDRDERNLPGLRPGEIRAVDLFPNTSVIIRGTVVRIDTSTPIAPGRTLIEFRGLGIRGEPAADRAMRVRDHNQYWGPFGRNIPEDVLFVEAVEESNRRAAQYSVISRREQGRAQDDAPLRAYYGVWSRYMGRSASDPFGKVVR